MEEYKQMLRDKIDLLMNNRSPLAKSRVRILLNLLAEAERNS